MSFPAPAFQPLFTPVRIGPLSSGGRIGMAGLVTGHETADPDLQALTRHYLRQAEAAAGGLALIQTAPWAVLPEGRQARAARILALPDQVAPHQRMTARLGEAGVAMLMTLGHAGSAARHQEAQPTASLTAEDLTLALTAYAHAARLAVAAGYAGLVLRLGPEDLPGQLLAEGEERGRRFVTTLLMGLGEALHGVPLLLEAPEIPTDLPGLIPAGTVAGLILPPAARALPGLPVLRSLQDPVTPEAMLRLILTDGAAALLLGRPLLAEPRLPALLRAGQPGRIRTCLACARHCAAVEAAESPITCALNPVLPAWAPQGGPVVAPRPIAVIGAGPAGMAAALRLAERGHLVTLFEQAAEAGGQLRFAARVPGKQRYRDWLQVMLRSLQRAGVRLRLETQANARDLSGFAEVVLATGIRPRPGLIEGEDHPSAQFWPEVFTRPGSGGGRVMVLGGGPVALDAAAFLMAEGAQVTLLTRKPVSPRDAAAALQLQDLRARGLKERAVPGARRISDGGVTIRVSRSVAQTLPADRVVLATGPMPDLTLLEPLHSLGRAVHVIGGAAGIEGLDLARSLAEAEALACRL